MSNSRKTRLQAFGDQLVRAATTPDVPAQSETQPAAARNIGTSGVVSRESTAPPDQDYRPGKVKAHLTRLRPIDHQRFLTWLTKALRLPPEAIDQLPPVFLDPQLRPLKIGIRDDLMQRYGLESRNARRAIRHTLGAGLTSRLPYQRAMLEYDHRYDLDGNIAGVVSDEDRAAARKCIAQIWEKIKKVREEPK